MLLRFLECGERSRSHWVAAWFTQSLGVLFALAGSFNDPNWEAPSVLAIWLMGIVAELLIVSAAFAYISFGKRYPNKIHLKIFAFPVIMTGLWLLVG